LVLANDIKSPQSRFPLRLVSNRDDGGVVAAFALGAGGKALRRRHSSTRSAMSEV